MTLTESQRYDAALRMIKAVTGDQYGDGMVVTDVGIGYAAGPARYDDSEVWVLGNWNDRTKYVDGERIVLDDTPGRLFNALERIGVNGEWCDEWDRCQECDKLIRTVENSYSWTPEFVSIDDRYTCRQCAIDQLPDTLESVYVNEVNQAVTWLSKDELAEHGWIDPWPNDYDAARGFHPGQNDTPRALVQRFEAEYPDRDWLFVITDKGQFDIHFRILMREETGEDD